MRIDGKSDDEVRTLVRTARGRRHRLGRPRRRVRQRHARLRTPLGRGHAADAVRAGRDGPSRPRRASSRTGPYFDFSYEHIVASVEGSLAALRTDRIDVLLLHRPDALVEPDEVARAFDELEAAGKVRAFGVSNHTPRQIDLLKQLGAPAAGRQPAAAVDHPRAARRPGRRGQHGRLGPVARPRRRRPPRLLPPERHHRPGVVAVPGRLLHRAVPRQRRTTRSSTRSSTGSRRSTTSRRSPSPPRGSPGTRPDMQVVLGTTTPERVAGAAPGPTCRSPGRSGTSCSAPRGTACPDADSGAAGGAPTPGPPVVRRPWVRHDSDGLPPASRRGDPQRLSEQSLRGRSAMGGHRHPRHPSWARARR